MVGANGEFKIARDAFNLFVGECFLVDDILVAANNHTDSNNNVLVADESVLKKVRECKGQGYQKVASTRMSVVPIGYGDVVFASQEEIAEAITKIYQTFKSVDFFVFITKF